MSRRHEPSKRQQSIFGKMIVKKTRTKMRTAQRSPVRQAINASRNSHPSSSDVSVLAGDHTATPNNLDAYVESCRRAENPQQKGIPSDLLAELASLPGHIPMSNSIYLDGHGHWCFDWDDESLDRCVYTTLVSEDRLLVVVDLDNGSFLRLPCNLNEDKPLKHLMIGLNVALEHGTAN